MAEHLILYDGVCGFCNRAVHWVLEADRAARFQFAPLQGPSALAIRRRHAEIPDDVDSIVYVRSQSDTERVFWGPQAIFRICAELPGPWRLLACLRWLPSAWTDFGYRVFARNRYRWFGRLDSCPLPQPEERLRFLE